VLSELSKAEVSKAFKNDVMPQFRSTRESSEPPTLSTMRAFDAPLEYLSERTQGTPLTPQQDEETKVAWSTVAAGGTAVWKQATTTATLMAVVFTQLNRVSLPRCHVTGLRMVPRRLENHLLSVPQ